ncbi:gene transfer agent family protein [Paracoccus stylophorae]|uniref:Gene transfer agent family protein n=1 Tax=Paracoccus stylophorae TaxID=659350 RepID=A0ABY7SRW3_9RHOB|nr:gene transfer agent family protein [Paracoccus stylophorae]WCR09589.1 gene transfer agent family protein [Paracoccus stylophorae]
MNITHRAFFGDGERDFLLSDPMIAELETKTSTGIGALFVRLSRSDFRLVDLVEIIRLGLIGANTDPQEASRLVETYAKNRPIGEILPLALDVITARWMGADEVQTND